MKIRIAVFIALLAAVFGASAQPHPPLRVFIRASAKTHGPGEHDYPRFLADWSRLLNERGATATGALKFPTKAQLAKTDVLVIYAADGGSLSAEERRRLVTFLQRGGGLVVLHDGVCSASPEAFKTFLGGAKQHGVTNWSRGLVGLYFQDHAHPITGGVANFDLDDELFFDLQMQPAAKVLATTFHTAKEVVPQMWVYENALAGGRPYRAFASLQGHNYASFSQPHYRGLILRGIAWAGKRDVDLLTNTDELAHFRYPAGGPTRPEEAAKKIKFAPDFKINLVAAEPLVVKPISLDWDARGRMWVVVTPEYPFKTDASPAKDAILILEDTDGDGRMDKRHVFHTGLTLPTSLVFHRDGVIVAQAPQILWLRDTDGDGVADKTETLFTGFGTYDTHAVISNFRWGLDGWIYGTQGYSGSQSTNVVNTRGQSFGKIGNGIFRFKADGSAIEQVSSYGGNTWGLDFAWDGELFFSKANGPHISHLAISEKFLARGKMPGTTSDKSIEDHQKVFPRYGDARHEYVQVAPVGVFTGASGCMVYDGAAWPMKYNNSVFVCEPTVHIVHEDAVTPVPEGVGYEALKREESEFLAGEDLWFRPVHLRYGPDGAMYVLDFYNQAISHNDIRGVPHGPGNAAVRPDRDHQHGRIWRVQHQDAQTFDVPPLATAAPADLVAQLEHPNGWVRGTAQRLLIEKGDRAAVEILTTLLGPTRLPHARVHALWCLHHLASLTDNILLAAITNAHPAVQKNALKIFIEAPTPATAALEKAIIKQFKDTGDRVRLHALLALGQAPFSKAANEAVWKLFPDLKDVWSRSAVLNVARLAPMDFIKGAFASDKADSYRELLPPLIEEIGYKRQADEAATVIQAAVKAVAGADKLKVAVLESLNKHLGGDFAPAWSTNLEAAIQKLVNSDSRSVRVASLALATFAEQNGALAGDATALRASLLTDAENPKLKDEERVALIPALMSVKGIEAEVIPVLGRVLATGATPAVQKQIITDLGRTDNADAGRALIENFARLSTENKQLAFSTLLKRAAWGLALVDALERQTIKLNDLGVQGASRLQSHADKTLATRATAVIAAIQGPRIQEKDALIARFTKYLDQRADLKNGKAMFQKNCAICHKFGGEGKDLGPDLTGIGTKGVPVVLMNILDPNRVLEGNFIAYNITTKKQEEYSGLIARENAERVVLRNLEGEVEIRRADIAAMTSSGLSLMPEGLEALGETTIRDIVAHLLAAPKETSAVKAADKR